MGDKCARVQRALCQRTHRAAGWPVDLLAHFRRGLLGRSRSSLEDIDRIEVIRGPGGSIWGANAVNGVVNIITKKASETKGAMVVAGGGNLEPGFGTVQYGGAAGKANRLPNLFEILQRKPIARHNRRRWRGWMEYSPRWISSGQHGLREGQTDLSRRHVYRERRISRRNFFPR